MIHPLETAPAEALVAPGETPWPDDVYPDPFVCAGRRNDTLTTSEDGSPTVTIRRDGDSFAVETDEPIVDAGLRAEVEVVRSYKFNQTNYLVAMTEPGVTKIHYTFFLYLNDEGRGLFELRSLSGSLQIYYYDVVCSPAS